MRAWRLYSSLLTSHPRSTNLVTAGVVSAIADIAAQRIEYNHSRARVTITSGVTSDIHHHHTATMMATPSAISLLPSTSSNVPLPVTTLAAPEDSNGIDVGVGLGVAGVAPSTTSNEPNRRNTNSIHNDGSNDTCSSADSDSGGMSGRNEVWLPDAYRLATMTLYGTIMGGHIFSLWYRWLDRTWIGTSARVVATKVILNQLTMAPINNSCLYGWIQLTDPNASQHGLTRPDGAPAVTFGERWYAKLYNDLPRTTVGSLLFWGPYQTINFRFVPSPYRVLYQSGGVLAWTIWVNLIGHK
jgi:hypothetical protein